MGRPLLLPASMLPVQVEQPIVLIGPTMNSLIFRPPSSFQEPIEGKGIIAPLDSFFIRISTTMSSSTSGEGIHTLGGPSPLSLSLTVSKIFMMQSGPMLATAFFTDLLRVSGYVVMVNDILHLLMMNQFFIVLLQMFIHMQSGFRLTRLE